MRNLKKWMSLVLVCSLWMLMFACGTPGEGNNGNNGSNSGNSQSSANGLCGAGCPTGQFCWNGICAIGCNTNAECASDQYCDTDIKQCANKTIPTCPDTPCKENQTCVNGYCSAKAAPPPKKKDESGACKLAVDGNDGCKSNEICIDAEEEKTQCRAFPRCPQSGQCPTGLTGAVCNDKIIPKKDRICLVGACQKKEHCPSSWNCVVISGSPLGFCSDGALGRPCTKDAPCKEGLKCMQASPTLVGVCLSTSMPNFPDFP